jgi:DNA-binding response OmpR family regulator
MTKKKILLVDDSGTALMMARMILTRGHYDIVTAVDGEQAIERALQEHPDLVLLDVVMPKKGGFEVCRELRSQEITRDVPIIMVTTRGEEGNVEQGFASGCNDYITKPINGLELLSKVRNFLGE